jgi:hypothetical protein
VSADTARLVLMVERQPRLHHVRPLLHGVHGEGYRVSW